MSNDLIVKIRRLNPEVNDDIPLPQYMSAQAAGMDICAAVPDELVLKPGQIALIPTGYAIAIPEGYEAQIRPRSGLAVKFGIGLINSPGTIDADYRGEVKIPVINLGSDSYTVKRGQRIAQMVLKRVYRAELQEVVFLDKTARDTGGFGHTG